MEGLTDRQETILALIIHEFVESGEAIGSKTLLERYGLRVSTATIPHEKSAP